MTLKILILGVLRAVLFLRNTSTLYVHLYEVRGGLCAHWTATGANSSSPGSIQVGVPCSEFLLEHVGLVGDESRRPLRPDLHIEDHSRRTDACLPVRIGSLVAADHLVVLPIFDLGSEYHLGLSALGRVEV